MEMIKKYGITAVCILAIVALFLPMASVEVSTDYGFGEYNAEPVNLSGFEVALQGYVCMLLIVGPVLILAANYIELVKKFKAIIQTGVSALGIILTFVGYLQASSIASDAQMFGMGYVDCEASIGFGGILCIVAYLSMLALTVLFQKEELRENVMAFK